MRRYFIFATKKCRIYAAFGVSQTPKLYYNNKQENQWALCYWGNNDAENVYLHPTAIQQIKHAFETIDVLISERLCRICQFLGEEKSIVEAKYKKRLPPVLSIKYDERIEKALINNDLLLPVRMVNTSPYADYPVWERRILIPVHQEIEKTVIKKIYDILKEFDVSYGGL